MRGGILINTDAGERRISIKIDTGEREDIN